MCYRLTLQQRVRFLCHCVASGCSMESLQGAVVAAGLSPPPREVLIAAAAAGRVEVCRWLVEALGCLGLHRLSCLCLLSAAGARAGAGPETAEAALAWLNPDSMTNWGARAVTLAARGDIPALQGLIEDKDGDDVIFRPFACSPLEILQRTEEDSKCLLRLCWGLELRRMAAQWDLEQPSPRQQPWSHSAGHAEFYQGPHAAQAVSRLAEIPPRELTAYMLSSAAEAGNADAVHFLLSRGLRLRYRPRRIDFSLFDNDDFLASFSPTDAQDLELGSNVEVLQALHAAGCMGDPSGRLQQGLEAGSRPVVSWLAETFGAEVLGADVCVYPTAARSGSVALLQALPGLMGPTVPRWHSYRELLEAAARSGCEEAVDCLAAQDPSERGYGISCYAVHNGDLSMMQRLRKLGGRWGRHDLQNLAEAASRVPASAPALPWAVEPGVPASWEAAAAEARAEMEAQAQAAAGVSGQAAHSLLRFRFRV
ncbi:hypothetical protein HYH03_018443 [Edaphochlamys debaryana]|uniref:Uncharacterized protein n=1 Tax=Edaphochlamys debaryana TaxID=47281 RepID=A0A836BMX8_9CHLO|nr:hypothetical protein HYH03_018443 [Edaphochlamys debaryana]|eukprot:KAG2482636.1 hypothetical protein HYH03_018443 [Edaphochlamys debaryana]